MIEEHDDSLAQAPSNQTIMTAETEIERGIPNEHDGIFETVHDLDTLNE